MSGFGKDFNVYWQIGQAVLAGLDPYAVNESLYPPITTFFYAIFALLPLVPAFGIWTGLNILLFWKTVRGMFPGSSGLAWFAFTPTIFILLSGQNDIVFFWLGSLLVLNGWKAALAGALLTLKPQMALVILPWFLVRWFFKDRALLGGWLGITLGLHALPLLVDPGLYPRWIAAMGGETGWRMLASPGIFTLVNFHVPLWFIALLALAAVLWGLFQDGLSSRTAQLFALPMGLWYDNILLTGAMPARLFIPLSWAAFVTAALVQNSMPLATLPILALAWRLAQTYRQSRFYPALPAAEH